MTPAPCTCRCTLMQIMPPVLKTQSQHPVCFLTLEGPDSFWPLCWGSKRQGATARSTCEAEIISLDSGVVGEAVPVQDLVDLVLNRPISLVCQQDNASVIQIVHRGI